MPPTRADACEWAMLALLLALPMACSFGTSMPVLEHSRTSAVLAIAAVLVRLVRMLHLRLLSPSALAVCLALIAIPTLVIQVQAASDAKRTYRQNEALGAQHLPVHVGAVGAGLLVDAKTQAALANAITTARGAGLAAGATVLDFTGEGPGIVYALGLRPLGVAWLLGGYPNSSAWAGRVVDRLSDAELKSAWVLSSPDNPRAISGWAALLTPRVGAGSHELVATVRVPAPSRWGGKVDTASLQMWRPKAQPAPAASEAGPQK